MDGSSLVFCRFLSSGDGFYGRRDFRGGVWRRDGGGGVAWLRGRRRRGEGRGRFRHLHHHLWKKDKNCLKKKKQIPVVALLEEPSFGDSAFGYGSKGWRFNPCPQLVLDALEKGGWLSFHLSTQQYLKWVPGYRQLKDLVRVLSVFALRVRVHSYDSREVDMVLDCTGLEKTEKRGEQEEGCLESWLARLVLKVVWKEE